MLGTKLSPWPCFTQEEANAVAAVVKSNRVNYWTGTEGRQFETEFAAWTGSEYAVALANGTLALDVALKAAGIGAGDEVIVTPRTFIASVSSVVNAGATPVFADVDRESGNISLASIERVATPRTRAIIPVHLAGWPCDMSEIMEWARTRRQPVTVIEDCAQAHGATVDGQSVGTWGDIGAWSFCQDKIMTTAGEGGMVTTNDKNLWRTMWSFKDHGKSWEAVYERQHEPGFRWLHESIGTNWRMLEVQAAVGRIQITRMASWSDRRRAIATRIAAGLAEFSDVVRAPMPAPRLGHAFYRFYAYVNPGSLGAGWTRDRIIAEIEAKGVPIFQGSCSEVYLEKAFDKSGFRPIERLQVARELGETSLMFLTHPTIEDAQLEKVIEITRHVLSQARG